MRLYEFSHDVEQPFHLQQMSQPVVDILRVQQLVFIPVTMMLGIHELYNDVSCQFCFLISRKLYFIKICVQNRGSSWMYKMSYHQHHDSDISISLQQSCPHSGVLSLHFHADPPLLGHLWFSSKMENVSTFCNSSSYGSYCSVSSVPRSARLPTAA